MSSIEEPEEVDSARSRAVRMRLKGLWLFSEDSLRRAVRNSSWLLVGQAASMVVGLVNFMVVARQLGPSKYGVYAAAFSYVTLFMVLRLPGFDTVVIRDVARRHPAAEMIYRRVLGLNYGAGALGVVLALLGLTLVRFAPGTAELVVLLTVIIAVQPASTLMEAVFQGRQDMKWLAVVDVSRQILNTAVIVPLVVLLPSEQRTVAVAATLSGSYCFAFVADSLICRRYVGSPLRAQWPRIPRETLKAGLIFTAFSLCGFLFGKVDVLLASQFLSPKDVGLYAVAMTIATRMLTPVSVLGIVLLPLAASELRSGHVPTSRSLQRTMLVFAGIGLGLAVTAWIASGPLIPILFGTRYDGTRDPLLPLLVGLVVSAGVLPLTTLLQAGGHEFLLLRALVVRAVSNAGLDFLFLAAGLGTVGVAWATVVSTTLFAIVVIAIGRRVWPSGSTRNVSLSQHPA